MTHCNMIEGRCMGCQHLCHWSCQTLYPDRKVATEVSSLCCKLDEECIKGSHKKEVLDNGAL